MSVRPLGGPPIPCYFQMRKIAISDSEELMSKYRGGTSDATSSSSLIVQLFMISIFHLEVASKNNRVIQWLTLKRSSSIVYSFVRLTVQKNEAVSVKGLESDGQTDNSPIIKQRLFVVLPLTQKAWFQRGRFVNRHQISQILARKPPKIWTKQRGKNNEEQWGDSRNQGKKKAAIELDSANWMIGLFPPTSFIKLPQSTEPHHC